MFNANKFKPNYQPYCRKQFDPASVYYAELPDLKEYENDYAWACCPFHEDQNPSFCVNLETGSYKCHSTSCGASGGSIVSFVSALYDLNYSDAIAHLEEFYG